MQVTENRTSINDFRQLLVWQRSMSMVKDVYRLTARFPDTELYGFVSQMRRAALSVPSNIAEGHERATTGEFIQFLGTARGSLAELQTQLLLAEQLELGDSSLHQRLQQNIGELKKMMAALVSALQKRKSR